MIWFGDGPRRRRMIRGTIVRIGELAMRYGLPSQLATLDCTSSRRSTVMCARPRATAVTTVYQRDSSSKRPRASVVSAARPPTRVGVSRGGHGIQGFAPSGRRLRRPWTPCPPRGRMHLCEQADACSATAKPPFERSGLDKGSFHISTAVWWVLLDAVREQLRRQAPPPRAVLQRARRPREARWGLEVETQGATDRGRRLPDASRRPRAAPGT
jgi:hypothetical protein